MRLRFFVLFLTTFFCTISAQNLDLSRLAASSTTINVSVVGMVEQPGVYQLPAGSRVSQAVEISQVKIPEPQTNLSEDMLAKDNDNQQKTKTHLDEKKNELTYLADDIKPGRHVELLRGSKNIAVDLGLFLAQGQDKYNPLLQDGDVIRVFPVNSVVYIDGAVNRPGRYELLEGDHLSTVLQLTMGTREDADKENVEIIRSTNPGHNPDTLRISISQPGQSGNDPLLKTDDRIMVRAIPNFYRLNTFTVDIFGEVKNPGEYQALDGYRFYDVVKLAGGFLPASDLNNLEIARSLRGADTVEKIGFSFKSNNSVGDGNPILQDGDRIYVRTTPRFNSHDYVRVAGQIVYPGLYAIEENKTTLLDILMQCEGPLEFADLDNAFLQRRSQEDVVDLEFERLKMIPRVDMTDMEYAYFKAKSTEMVGKFAIKFRDLWTTKDKSKDVLLKSGDYIYIPDFAATVKISGAFRSPGLVPYKPGQTYAWYVQQAGGFTWNARKSKARLIRSTTGAWTRPSDDTVVNVGDMIFVPEKQEIEWWTITKDTVSFAASILAIVAIVHNLN